MLRRLPPRAKFCGESGANSSLFSKNPFRAIGDDPLRQAKRTNRDDQCFKHNVECISVLLQTQPLQLVCEPERSCIVMHIMHGRGAHLGAERRPRRSLEERMDMVLACTFLNIAPIDTPRCCCSIATMCSRLEVSRICTSLARLAASWMVFGYITVVVMMSCVATPHLAALLSSDALALYW